MKNDTQEHIGGILAARDTDFKGGKEITYSITDEHQNKGYATEALIAVTQEVVKENKVPTLWIYPDADASIRVAEKANYFNTGTHKEPYDLYIPRGLSSNIDTRKLSLSREL